MHIGTRIPSYIYTFTTKAAEANVIYKKKNPFYKLFYNSCHDV